MRAELLVRALARRFRVHLRVIPIQEHDPTDDSRAYEGPADSFARIWKPPGVLFRLRSRRASEADRLPPTTIAHLEESVQTIEADVLVCFRHYLASPALELRRRRGLSPIVLDLDEVESSTRRSLAALQRSRGAVRAARRLERQARQLETLEKAQLPRFDQVWVSSEREAGLVPQGVLDKTMIVPNATTAADSPAGDRELRRARPVLPQERATARMLFVGNLHYLPNRDAAELLVGSVLPILKRAVARGVELQIIGSGPASVLESLAVDDSVIVSGPLPSLDSAYAAADVAVVPLRAGGGTRIKLLEALAYGCPVVSTTIGAEGLGLVPGRHLLVADGPSEFAEACRQLLGDAAMARDLAAAGSGIVRDRFSPRAVADSVDRALDALGADRGPRMR